MGRVLRVQIIFASLTFGRDYWMLEAGCWDDLKANSFTYLLADGGCKSLPKIVLLGNLTSPSPWVLGISQHDGRVAKINIQRERIRPFLT